ncbi:30S ribosomal protein S6e [Candidatus Methanosphaera massiliense]|jgi:small subunit ribosomal protein S6e|uniref:30S ribosomal protein S6e n=1 Tax=Methanosphaera TaxID=2316 RepID=UPI000DC57A27|nr:30S ribosomal protein S6e [Candidatus Methanosphaera massiliense]MDD6286469.1 30S ribosomal protein S6e [Methanobacteriaceae archaeon]MDE4078892.1 30S ribosomal protein S6e [Candidatus Methanosphaera massiliense]RAP44995.1 MAG: 30S ribosomal protein S6e [Methanosphaera sp. SHI1033]
MVYKVVVSDEDVTYQLELDDKDAKVVNGLKIGEEFNGGVLGLKGYKLRITGGSDKNGFPMKADVDGTRRFKSLVSEGTGFKPQVKGLRRRKTVRGNTIADDISQINVKVSERGEQTLTEIFAEPEEEQEE